ncbi:MAG: hypothetical protein LWX54_03045 [Deltaproteobacteria bacterium]|jgi:hypothetical protein|nr:hypothetical protein [Deltaproteobacteria bacterium]
MAVYIAAAYRLSPYDAVTRITNNNLENIVVNDLCKADIQSIKRDRIIENLKEEHKKEIDNKINDEKYPNSYTEDDIGTYININKDTLINRTKKMGLRGIMLDPVVMLQIALVVLVILYTVVAWVKDYRAVTRWGMLFVCWIFCYITFFTTVEVVRLNKKINNNIKHNIDKIDKEVILKVKKKCNK